MFGLLSYSSNDDLNSIRRTEIGSLFIPMIHENHLKHSPTRADLKHTVRTQQTV